MNQCQIQIGDSVFIDHNEYVTLKVEVFDMQSPYEVTDTVAHGGQVCIVTEVRYPIRLKNELVGHQTIEIVMPH